MELGEENRGPLARDVLGYLLEMYSDICTGTLSYATVDGAGLPT